MTGKGGDDLPAELKKHTALALPALLLSAGLLGPVLGALGLQTGMLTGLLIVLVGTCLLEAATLTRKTMLWGTSFLAGLFLLWLLGFGGLALLKDLFLALRLRLSGISSGLSLISREAAVFFSVLLCLLGFLLTRKPMGSLPAVLLVVIASLLIWLGNYPSLTLLFLPAVTAVLILLLRERHEEVSFFRILPWIVGLVLLSYLMVPQNGVEIPTLKRKADNLRQAILDRVFFTEPRDVFSLSVEGYYPEGTGQLGGPVQPSANPVMQVSTPRSVYLRGAMMNEYTGRSWRNSLGGRRYLWNAPTSAQRRRVLFDQDVPEKHLETSLTEVKTVSIRMLSDSVSTLFSPQRVRDLRTGGELVPYFSDASELFITRNLRAGDTWSVSAVLLQAGDPGLGTLTEAAAASSDPQWESIRETYTALPAHLEEPVWQMAATITAPFATPYEKAYAVQDYLMRSYRYKLEVQPQPSDLDFVTNFLFNTKEGYCTYFASAMTVLCRMAGLPARYVEGYLAEPDSQGEALVTGLNGHAWTEVYFKGFGWIPFDATPRRSNNASDRDTDASSGKDPVSDPEEDASPSQPPPESEPSPDPSPASDPVMSENSDSDTPPDETPSPTPAPTPTPEPEKPVPSQEPVSGPKENRRSPSIPPILWILAVLLLIAAGLAFRWILTSPEYKEKHAREESVRFEIWLQETTDRLSAGKWVRKSGETPMSWTRRLDQEGILPVRLAPLGECVSLLRYRSVAPVPEDTALARQTALDLRKGLPVSVRLRYGMRRIFGSGKASDLF